MLNVLLLFFPPELPTDFITPLPDYTVMEKETVTLECEVSKPDKTATWLKNGEPIEPSEHAEIRMDVTKHFLTLTNCVLEDDAKYTIRVEGKESTGKLTVQG